MLALLGASGLSVAIACGEYFSFQLTYDRERTFAATPANSFAWEMARLLPKPTDGLAAREPGPYGEPPELGPDPGPPDPNSPALALYDRGAERYGEGDYAAAKAAWQALLALPPEQARPRAVWAAYMLGRAELAAAGDPPQTFPDSPWDLSYEEQQRVYRHRPAERVPSPDAAERAAGWFARARDLARQGMPDPQGLAVASLGWEARPYFWAGVEDADALHGLPVSDGAGRDRLAARSTRALARAAQLYAEQAAHGSRSAVQSLRMLAQELLRHPHRLEVGIADPMVRQVVVSIILAQDAIPSAPDGGDNRARQWDVYDQTFVPTSNLDPGQGARLLAALKAQADPATPGVDRLAALAYRMGSYTLAKEFAELSQTPLSHWVRAKLALQYGDLERAAAAYAAVAKAFPATGEVMDPAASRILQGERGLLSLARQEYVQALELLFPVRHQFWSDVAYVAERVLTIDELRSFVDRQVPTEPTVPPPGVWRVTSLRELLARRLVRAGQVREALPYFIHPENRAKAAAYADALAAASSGPAIERAKASFVAARLARADGMDIMATELAPDSHASGGYFPDTDVPLPPGSPFVSEGERRRADASRARPDLRFHYRYVAVDLALKAAAGVPARSQAYAAILCRATSWVINRDPEKGRELYRQYLANGAYIPGWGRYDFGRCCPEPDFAAAEALRRKLWWDDVWDSLRRHRWEIAAAFLAAALAGVGTALAYRRRKRALPA